MAKKNLYIIDIYEYFFFLWNTHHIIEMYRMDNSHFLFYVSNGIFYRNSSRNIEDFFCKFSCRRIYFYQCSGFFFSAVLSLYSFRSWRIKKKSINTCTLNIGGWLKLINSYVSIGNCNIVCFFVCLFVYR